MVASLDAGPPPAQAAETGDGRAQPEHEPGLHDAHENLAPPDQTGTQPVATHWNTTGRQACRTARGDRLERASQFAILGMTFLMLLFAVLAWRVGLLSYRKTPTEIAVEGLSDGAYINGDTFVNVVATGTEHNRVVVSLFLLGRDQPVRTWDNQRAIEILPAQMGLDDGVYYLRIGALHTEKATKYESISFHLDRTPPSFKVFGLKDGDVVQGTLNVAVGVEEEVSPVEATFYLDGLELALTAPIDTLELPDGEHRLEVRVSDRAGNSSAQDRRFVVDNAPPRILSLGIASSVRGSVLVAPEYEEPNLKSVQLLLNGEELASSIPATWDTTRWTDGTGELELRITDVAGHETTQRATVVVDNTPPHLIAGLLPRINVHPARPFNATPLRCEDCASVAFVLEGISSTNPMVDLSRFADGAAPELEVVATDAVGNTTSASIELMIRRDSLNESEQRLDELRRGLVWLGLWTADLLLTTQMHFGFDVAVTSTGGLDLVLSGGTGVIDPAVGGTTVLMLQAGLPVPFALRDGSSFGALFGASQFVGSEDSEGTPPVMFDFGLAFERWRSDDSETSSGVCGEYRAWLDLGCELQGYGSPLSVRIAVGIGSAIRTQYIDGQLRDDAPIGLARFALGPRVGVPLAVPLAVMAFVPVLRLVLEALGLRMT